MNRKAYILVFSAESAWVLADAKPIAKALNEGDGFYALDGNICFVKTAQSLEALTERLKASPIGNGRFFLADVTEAASAGNMAPKFWKYLRAPDGLVTAAE